MKSTTKTVVELDQADIRTALIEYVNRKVRGGKASPGGEAEIERKEGSPGARGRDGGYVAVVTIEEDVRATD